MGEFEKKMDLIKLVNELQDKLDPLGGLSLDLPQIAVIGGQSAGKSSVLEAFVGRDFLPRGNNIVTRRPLILQLINDKDSTKAYGEFLHVPDKKFFDFSQIRDEINNETDREVKDNYGISSKAINLKIYSPDVLDLTLVDLPGMTRMPVGNQPKDIEVRIKDIILQYIKNDNCLILAVTAANQDLATSDALQMAEQVDPKGERTIGVLTKLDLMDDGTNARDILIGKHLPLKMGYIGVINRSQRDIDTRKDMKTALADEKDFFSKHSAYKDVSDRLGIAYLQKFLNAELKNHIMKILPPLKHKFLSEKYDLLDKLEKLESPIDTIDIQRTLSETNEEFRKNYESSIGGRGVRIDITKLSGGSKINLVMNDSYVKEIERMAYDENRMRREIATAVTNYYGIHLGVFTPDPAFKAVVEHQIEQFRKPSIVCVEWVSQELEGVVKESVGKIKRFSTLKQLYAMETLDFVRECKKRCKQRVDHFVEMEKSYLNTIHEDFVGSAGVKSFKNMDNSKPISESQLKVSAQVVEENNAKKGDDEAKSSWISYTNTEYWFVLHKQELKWFKDETCAEKKGLISLNGAKLDLTNKSLNVLSLILNKKSINRIFKSNTMELSFDSAESRDQWKTWLEMAGVHSPFGDPTFYSDSTSLSNLSLDSENESSNEQMAYEDHIKSPVDQIKLLVDSYIQLTKKKFKDYVPKMCTIEMMDATLDFIAVELRLCVSKQINSVDDIINGDPDEELRRNLTIKSTHYSDAIEIIEKFSLQEI